MNDLVDMLTEEGIGSHIAGRLINCLLFADDIALIAESENDLQRMLDVAYSFVNKWNLSFNPKKSKVLVIGKRVNKSKRWHLGQNTIEEANEYKYLGVYFSRSLKFNYHIKSYVKENAERKLNYCIRILAEHGRFNRFNFGDALWNSVLRPSVSHGCTVWLPTSNAHVEALESIQYKMGKLILNTRMNIPKSALLCELGWEPINAFMNRQRVSYFARFNELPDNRLCKFVFNILKTSACSEYSMFFRNIFNEIGLDHYFDGNINVKTFNSFYGKYVRACEFEIIASKSSLEFYRYCTLVTGKQTYISEATDFDVARLKLLARTNCLPLNATLFRMSMVDSDKCKLCSINTQEDLSHFFLNCPKYQDIRRHLLDGINIVFNEHQLDFDFEELSSFQKLQFLIGDQGFLLYDTLGAKCSALGQEFLSSAFKIRNQVLEF